MKDLDATLDHMENARFNYLYAPIITRLEKESHFRGTELLCIAMIYHKFVLESGPRAKYMTQMQLSKICEVMFNIMDRDINTAVINRISHCDPLAMTDPKFSPDRHVSLPSFAKMFTIYFTTDMDKRIHFIFTIYDTLDRGFLDREIISRCVDNFFHGMDEDELFELRKDMVDLLIMKFDLNKDNAITELEYKNVVTAQPQLLEFLGQVFPSERNLDVVALCANILSWFDTIGNPLPEMGH